MKSVNRTRKTLQLWYAAPWLELLSDKVGGGEDDGGFSIEIPRFEQSAPSAPYKIYISVYNNQNHTEQETARKMSYVWFLTIAQAWQRSGIEQIIVIFFTLARVCEFGCLVTFAASTVGPPTSYNRAESRTENA